MHMKITICSPRMRLFQYFFLAALLAGFSVHAKIVDSFSTASPYGSSGWANGTFHFGDLIQQTNPAGQFSISTIAVANSLTSAKKNAIAGDTFAAIFTNLPTHTLEFKVLVNSILTNGTTTDGQALLGWVPASSDPSDAIPEAQQPRFVHNKSGRYESR